MVTCHGLHCALVIRSMNEEVCGKTTKWKDVYVEHLYLIISNLAGTRINSGGVLVHRTNSLKYVVEIGYEEQRFITQMALKTKA